MSTTPTTPKEPVMAAFVYRITRFESPASRYIGTMDDLTSAGEFVRAMTGERLIADVDNGNRRMGNQPWSWTAKAYTVERLEVASIDTLLNANQEALRESALAKLTPAEKSALGL